MGRHRGRNKMGSWFLDRLLPRGDVASLETPLPTDIQRKERVVEDLYFYSGPWRPYNERPPFPAAWAQTDVCIHVDDLALGSSRGNDAAVKELLPGVYYGGEARWVDDDFLVKAAAVFRDRPREQTIMSWLTDHVGEECYAALHTRRIEDPGYLAKAFLERPGQVVPSD